MMQAHPITGASARQETPQAVGLVLGGWCLEAVLLAKKRPAQTSRPLAVVLCARMPGYLLKDVGPEATVSCFCSPLRSGWTEIQPLRMARNTA